MSEDSVELSALASVDPLDSDAIELPDEADASVVLPAASDDASSDARDAATTVVASPSSPEPSDTSNIGLLPSPEPSTVASVVDPSSGSVAPVSKPVASLIIISSVSSDDSVVPLTLLSSSMPSASDVSSVTIITPSWPSVLTAPDPSSSPSPLASPLASSSSSSSSHSSSSS